MSLTTTMDDNDSIIHEKPGAQLAAQRALKEYSQEYVAGKLHLRVRIIELLEADDYHNMPEAVFIKGYLRAYAKLLGVAPEPLLLSFHQHYSSEIKLEKALWQSRKQSNRAERTIRWVTIGLSLSVLVAVGMWWESNRQDTPILAEHEVHQENAQTDAADDVRLTDLSTMRSLLSSVKASALTQETEGD